MRQLQISLEQLPQKLCEIPEAREKFLRLFNQPNAIKRAFMPMHQYGVLTAYLPQWQAIEGLMQFDLFHIYTVDEHTLRVMLKLESFLSQESEQEHPIAHRILANFLTALCLYCGVIPRYCKRAAGGSRRTWRRRRSRLCAITWFRSPRN